MKILWLSHFIPYPPKGGASQRSYYLLREVARAHDVHFFAFNDSTAPDESVLEEARRELGQFCRQIEICDPPARKGTWAYRRSLLFNLASRFPYSVDLLRSPAMQEALASLAGSSPVDILHTDAIELAELALATSVRARVLNHQNAESLLLSRRSERLGNPAARWYMALQARKLADYESRVLPRFDLNLAVSQEDLEVLQSRAPEARLAVVANGVDIEYFTPRPAQVEPHAMVFIGGLTWFPNRDAVDFLASEIWPLIRRDLPDATCTLIGRIPQGAASPALPEGMRAVGFLDDIRDPLAGAAALLVPLRVGGGTRLKILDGLASGKAIVSTSIGCEGLGLKHERELLIADRPADFAAQAVRACRDSALREALGRAGRARVESDFSWAKIGAEYRGLLDELAHRL